MMIEADPLHQRQTYIQKVPYENSDGFDLTRPTR